MLNKDAKKLMEIAEEYYKTNVSERPALRGAYYGITMICATALELMTMSRYPVWSGGGAPLGKQEETEEEVKEVQ